MQKRRATAEESRRSSEVLFALIPLIYSIINKLKINHILNKYLLYSMRIFLFPQINLKKFNISK